MTARLLEDRVAVGEGALLRREGALAPLVAVPDAHARDGLRDLLAVGADILHRRRPGEPGDAGERLDARPALGDGAGDDVVPHLSGGDDDVDVLVVRGLDADPLRRDAHDGAAEAVIGDDEVGAAGQEQQGRAHLVRGPDGGDDLVEGLGGDEGVGRPADAHGRERRQLDAVLGRAHQSSRATARQRPSTLSSPQVTVSSTVASRVCSSRDFTTPATAISAPAPCGTTTGLVKRVP